MCISDAEHIVAAFMLQEICPCNFVLCCGRCNLITLRTAHTIHNECKREWTRKWWQRKNVVYAHASSSCTERWKNKQRSKLILEWASKTALGRYMYKTRINDEWWFRQDELQRWIDTRNWNWLLEFQMKNKKKTKRWKCQLVVIGKVGRIARCQQDWDHHRATWQRMKFDTKCLLLGPFFLSTTAIYNTN